MKYDIYVVKNNEQVYISVITHVSIVNAQRKTWRAAHCPGVDGGVGKGYRKNIFIFN